MVVVVVVDDGIVAVFVVLLVVRTVSRFSLFIARFCRSVFSWLIPVLLDHFAGLLGVHCAFLWKRFGRVLFDLVKSLC